MWFKLRCLERGDPFIDLSHAEKTSPLRSLWSWRQGQGEERGGKVERREGKGVGQPFPETPWHPGVYFTSLQNVDYRRLDTRLYCVVPVVIITKSRWDFFVVFIHIYRCAKHLLYMVYSFSHPTNIYWVVYRGRWSHSIPTAASLWERSLGLSSFSVHRWSGCISEKLNTQVSSLAPTASLCVVISGTPVFRLQIKGASQSA